MFVGEGGNFIALAKRALVSLLLAFAQQYNVSVNVNRDSSDQGVEAAFRSVVKKVHPDKGGRVADAQRLQAAREKWRSAGQENKRPCWTTQKTRGSSFSSWLANQTSTFLGAL